MRGFEQRFLLINMYIRDPNNRLVDCDDLSDRMSAIQMVI